MMFLESLLVLSLALHMQGKVTVEHSLYGNVPRVTEKEKVSAAVQKKGLCRSEIFHIISKT